jgi:hypothetical protein
VNYRSHYDLYCFRPLLGGNSPTYSGLILKMNKGYKGRTEISRSSCGERGKWISCPLPEGYGALCSPCRGFLNMI